MCSDYWLDEGIECKQKHFISDEALAGYVASLSKDSANKHSGNVKCPAMNVKRVFVCVNSFRILCFISFCSVRNDSTLNCWLVICRWTHSIRSRRCKRVHWKWKCSVDSMYMLLLFFCLCFSENVELNISLFSLLLLLSKSLTLSLTQSIRFD